MTHIWFHGTDLDASIQILKNGFHADSWFAVGLEDAIEFGGLYVFYVALENRPKLDGYWQMCVSNPVSAEAIVRLTKFNPVILNNFPDRLKIVFESNIGDSEDHERL